MTLLCAAVAVFFSCASYSATAQSGTTPLQANQTLWTDSAGAAIEAHGGSVLKVGAVYYWIGDKRPQQTHSRESEFFGFNCYSSTDLAHWKFENLVLKPAQDHDLGPNRVAERAHVLYNGSTKTYVMYFKTKNSLNRLHAYGVATASTVCGDYQYLGSSYGPEGNTVDDLSLFKDVDGTGYLVHYSSGPPSPDGSAGKSPGIEIDKLSADYLKPVSIVAVIPGKREAPAIFLRNGIYFLYTSGRSGWLSNQGEYVTASTLAGPWSAAKPFGDSTTCNSQGGEVFQVAGSREDTFIYVGDTWNADDLGDSSYTFLPVEFDKENAAISCMKKWRINIETGKWSDADLPGKNE